MPSCESREIQFLEYAIPPVPIYRTQASDDQILNQFVTNQKMHILMKYKSDFKKYPNNQVNFVGTKINSAKGGWGYPLCQKSTAQISVQKQIIWAGY